MFSESILLQLLGVYSSDMPHTIVYLHGLLCKQ